MEGTETTRGGSSSEDDDDDDDADDKDTFRRLRFLLRFRTREAAAGAMRV